jgi:hypothetical protein
MRDVEILGLGLQLQKKQNRTYLLRAFTEMFLGKNKHPHQDPSPETVGRRTLMTY